MPTMQEQVVSKIRETAACMPAMQKRLLERSKRDAGADWEIARSVPLPAIYCIFNGLDCVYVGETGNIQRRLRSHVLLGGKHRLLVYCILLQDKANDHVRRRLEQGLGSRLRPSHGFVKGQAYLPDNIIPVTDYRCERCEHAWKPRMGSLPLRCPRCGSPKWNQSK